MAIFMICLFIKLILTVRPFGSGNVFPTSMSKNYIYFKLNILFIILVTLKNSEISDNPLILTI